MSRINPQYPRDIPKRKVPSPGFAYSELIAIQANRGVQVDENGRVSKWENQAMAFKIKPEDVTQEILELAMERFENAYWNDVTSQNVADFLEDAVEAGLVSPPCRILRSKHGYLHKGEIYIDDNTAQTSAMPGDSSEHWKGQTS
jgi:hypothetical protein